VSFDDTLSKWCLYLEKCIWCRCNLDLWHLTLKAISAIFTHMNLFQK